MSQCLRKRYVEFSENLPQFGLADAAMHERLALWADRSQVPDVFVDSYVLRHITRRESRGAASEAVDFSRFAGPFVSCPTRLKEGPGIGAQNHRWPFPIDRGQPCFDPYPNGILMNGKQAGEFFNRVGAVDLDSSVVGLALPHDTLPKLLHEA